MKYLFYILCLFFSLGQLGRITLFNRQINFYLYEIFLFLFLFIYFLKYKFYPIKNCWKSSKVFFIFLAILLLSLINNFWQYSTLVNTVGFLYWLRLAIYSLYGVYLSYELKKNQKFKKTIHQGIKIIIFFTIITTTVQYFLYPDLRNLFYLGWDPHLGRTFGVFFDTSIAAAIYGLIFLYSQNKIVKLIYLIFLVLSFSRSAYLGFFIVFIYLIIKKIYRFNQFILKDFLSIIFVISFFVFLVILAPKPLGEGAKLTRTYTIISRIKDYQEGFSLFIKKPLFGYGFNRLKYIRNLFYSNSGSSFSSSYITIATSSGIIGIIGLIGLILYVWKKYKQSRDLIIFIGIISIFDNVILHPFIIFLLISLLFDR